jgi:hypothetical protein
LSLKRCDAQSVVKDASLTRRKQAVYHAKQRRLARAGLAYDAGKAPPFNFKAYIVNRNPIAKAARKPFDDKHSKSPGCFTLKRIALRLCDNDVFAAKVNILFLTTTDAPRCDDNG